MNQAPSSIRTRFAPSPTGYLHIGSARTALFNALIARSYQGTWFLRIEDTDRTRLQTEALVSVLRTLHRLGIIPEEGVTLDPVSDPDPLYGIYQHGSYGPYIQSQRLHIYHERAQDLINRQLAYWDYTTSEKRSQLQNFKQITKRPINYFAVNKDDVSEHELYASIEKGLSDPRKPALRYKLQRNQCVTYTDLLLGEIMYDLNLEEDFIFLKSDGFPTYHLAHLVDDHEMKTTHVIRAQEWLPSLALHKTMYIDTYGYSLEYIHIPFILGQQGNKKLSKRDGNVNVETDYLQKGYLPEAIINYIAFLGWNPGTEKELYLSPADF